MKKSYYYLQILKTVEANASVSQGKLSSQMKLNVSSVNSLMKDLIEMGSVSKVGPNPRRTKYYITPEGLTWKKHLAYKLYCQTMPYYEEVKKNIESRIAEVTKGMKTNIAIYGSSEHSETTYMVVSKMDLNFLGFFLEDSKSKNEKMFGYGIRELNLLNRDQECLLLLTENLHSDRIDDLGSKNVNTLNLVN